jgi:3-oxoacyl-[acyl-carrier protein] reductase
MSNTLAGRVALVTGASRGLGASIATKLAQAGAAVAVNYFASPDKAERLCNSIRQAGGQAAAFPGDVRDEKIIKTLAAQTEKAFGPIDILVPNATGPQPFIKIEDLTWQAFLDQFEFFVKSPMLLAQAVLPGMKARKHGRIINIGSEVFEKGVPEFSQYVAAKGAQLGLTRSWAMELAKHNITVNHVSPGWIPTERHANDSQELKDTYARNVPMGHMGVPDDIGDAVAFLASDAAKFITGQKLSVNGGNTLE